MDLPTTILLLEAPDEPEFLEEVSLDHFAYKASIGSYKASEYLSGAGSYVLHRLGVADREDWLNALAERLPPSSWASAQSLLDDLHAAGLISTPIVAADVDRAANTFARFGQRQCEPADVIHDAARRCIERWSPDDFAALYEATWTDPDADAVRITAAMIYVLAIAATTDAPHQPGDSDR